MCDALNIPLAGTFQSLLPGDILSQLLMAHETNISQHTYSNVWKQKLHTVIFFLLKKFRQLLIIITVTHTHTHTHTKKCYFKSLGKCYGCSLSHCEAMVSESLPEIVFSLWGAHDPHPSPQAAVVHGSAQAPLVLISVIHFNCFQVCCPIKATNSIQLSIHDCKSNLQQEIL